MESLNFNYTDYGMICEYSKVYETTGEQPLIFIPGNIEQIILTLTPTGGSSKIQTSTDSFEDLTSDSIVWVDHPAGAVATVLQDSCAEISAIRVVVVSGTAKLSIRGVS